ncbi:CAP domain-containing protein [Jatrophihabitans telluris]|uniref:CAP domain-containing protein n=1 Tax=Jatrophihabitans telluris TaxID=2038343 RepID=A0ABY4R4I1_9ACTN|nr:CAP domain-containing protein [Jatrophihabitans telluris]UQX89941.1 CAP domain-containing protein [Jatrophihabitans telluris]
MRIRSLSAIILAGAVTVTGIALAAPATAGVVPTRVAPAAVHLAVAPASAAKAVPAAKKKATVCGTVFNALNAARAARHLPALRWSPALQLSAHKHNQTMARTNTLSHQLSGEKNLGSRVSAQGVHWQFVAENIGWTSALNSSGALSIEKAMLGEKAPNDGHRKNILSRTAKSVGISVVIDAAHHKLWLTEDFAKS